MKDQVDVSKTSKLTKRQRSGSTRPRPHPQFFVLYYVARPRFFAEHFGVACPQFADGHPLQRDNLFRDVHTSPLILGSQKPLTVVDTEHGLAQKPQGKERQNLPAFLGWEVRGFRRTMPPVFGTGECRRPECWQRRRDAGRVSEKSGRRMVAWSASWWSFPQRPSLGDRRVAWREWMLAWRASATPLSVNLPGASSR